ncbi:MAG TPA: hypothetical protein VG942_19240 [Hyphomonadaceae bacterium]|nr:hypothetical protein [Hyphomonadaceae bacterium]
MISMEQLRPYLVYWPAAAAAGAFLMVVLMLVVVFGHGKQVKLARETIAKSRELLNTSRAAARESKKHLKVRKAELADMHKSAGKLFWKAEKTWVE